MIFRLREEHKLSSLLLQGYRVKLTDMENVRTHSVRYPGP